MSCSFKKKGNLWDDRLPESGPIEGSIEKECKGDNYYEKQYSYVMSSSRPEDPQPLRQTLEASTSGNQGGFLSWLTGVFGTDEQASQLLDGPLHVPRSSITNSNAVHQGSPLNRLIDTIQTGPRASQDGPVIEEITGGGKRRAPKKRKSSVKRSAPKKSKSRPKVAHKVSRKQRST